MTDTLTPQNGTSTTPALQAENIATGKRILAIVTAG